MIVTNLVVALMIVSNGMQQVKAIDVTGIKFRDGYSQTCYFTPDEVKTMYYPSVITNFLFSTEIRTDRMAWNCARCRQPWNSPFTPEDFFGEELQQIWFLGMPDKMCTECLALDNGLTPEHRREHDQRMLVLRTSNNPGRWESECKFCHKIFFWSDLGCVKVKEKKK